MAATGKPFRLGILGAAKIARAYIDAVKPAGVIDIAGIASREAAKAAAFAKEYGIAKSYGSYEALLADKDIDAVYNPLPNSLHAEWSIKAAEAGKHILCEKPFAVSGAEARSMLDAARRNGVHLVEGYPYLSQPQTLKVRELIASGAIGKLTLIRASFGIPFSDPTNIRLRPEVAGGSLMDAGAYPLSLVRVMAGERPSRVHAVARWAETGVDQTLLATLEFPSGLMAQISSSFATAYHRHAQIAGDAGAIEYTYLNHPPIGGAPVVTIRRGLLAVVPAEEITVEGGNGFLAETVSFVRMVADGPQLWNGASAEETVDIALTLEALLRSARSGRSEPVPA